MTTLTALEQRLAQATEGSRELDAALATAMGKRVVRYDGGLDFTYVATTASDDDGLIYLPHLTTSVDAAIAFCAAVLPDASFELTYSAAGNSFTRCRLWDWRRGPLMSDPNNEWLADGNVPLPVNICLATVRALIDKWQTK